MPTSPPLLDYGQRPRSLRWRRVRRVILLTMLGIVCVTGHHWRKLIAAKTRMLYWQRECMTYSPPPDLVVFEQDVREGQKLLGTTRQYRLFKMDGDPCVLFFPHAWTEAHRTNISAAPVFLHRLRSRNGKDRLVAIFVGSAYLRSKVLFADVSELGTLRRDPEVVPPSGLVQPEEEFFLIAVMPDETLRLFAGQSDETDAAHFTLDYMLSGRRGTIDGRLADSGDVLFTPRGGRFLRWRNPGLEMQRWWYPLESTHVPQSAEILVDPKTWNTSLTNNLPQP